MVVGARQSFQFSDKKPGFLEIIGLPWFRYRFLHNLISTTNL